MGSPMLPPDLHGLRDEAERLAQELFLAAEVHYGVTAAYEDGTITEAVLDLLRDLRRPESRDAALHMLARRLGWPEQFGAPSWEKIDDDERGLFYLLTGDDERGLVGATFGPQTESPYRTSPHITLDLPTDPAEALAAACVAVAAMEVAK